MSVVQGRADPQRELLDVESVAGHLLHGGWGVRVPGRAPAGSCSPMSCSPTCSRAGRGRPSTPGDVVASVIVLQTRHGLSDERGGGRR